jgi:Cu(I)/Ag(I) efflux system membrane fusion protein
MNNKIILTGAAMLVVGLGLGSLIFGNNTELPSVTKTQVDKPLFYRHPMNPEITSQTMAQDDMGMDYIAVYAEQPDARSEKKILFYRNPMSPNVTSPTPRKDSMGMDYVPVYADGNAPSELGTVTIDPVVVQNIGVRTAIATRKAMSRTVRAVGRVDFNEQSMARLHPKVEGWIEEIRVDKTGETVKKDAILLSIYSPKLVSTQQEYLLALNNYEALKDSAFDEISAGAKTLMQSTRERLKMLDVPHHQINELERTKKVKKNIHIHSPVAGTVTNIGSRLGQYITPKTELYMLVDLSKVWVFADIYENELPWIETGNEVEMTLASVPGRIFKGALSYIYPYAQSQTRTTRVRLVFDNADLALRPDMLADVSIKADTQPDAIVIPSEAVVRSGNRAQVFVVRGPGKFEPRKVELGIDSQGEVAILSGLSAGDEVVTSSQFLIDSESKLREATAKMMETLNAKAGGNTQSSDPQQHDHTSMSAEADSMDSTDSMDSMDSESELDVQEHQHD